MHLSSTVAGEVKLVRTIDFAHIVGDFYAFRTALEVECSKKVIGKRIPTENRQGIIHKDRIPKEIDVNTHITPYERLVKFKSLRLDFAHEKLYRPLLVSKDFVERFSKERHFNLDNYKGLYVETDEYSEMMDEKSDKRTLIFLSHYDHTWCDHEFRPLPLPIYFDYIHAQMDNKSYHLKKVQEVLEKRDDIEFVVERYSEEKIKSIPYYNVDEGRDKCLEFYWLPSVQVYRNICKGISEHGGSLDDLIQVIKEKDKLGIEKFVKNEEED